MGLKTLQGLLFGKRGSRLVLSEETWYVQLYNTTHVTIKQGMRNVPINDQDYVYIPSQMFAGGITGRVQQRLSPAAIKFPIFHCHTSLLAKVDPGPPPDLITPSVWVVCSLSSGCRCVRRKMLKLPNTKSLSRGSRSLSDILRRIFNLQSCGSLSSKSELGMYRRVREKLTLRWSRLRKLFIRVSSGERRRICGDFTLCDG